MIHRKTKHKVPSCNKYNSSGCDKPGEDCCYPHIMKQEKAQQNKKSKYSCIFCHYNCNCPGFSQSHTKQDHTYNSTGRYTNKGRNHNDGDHDCVEREKQDDYGINAQHDAAKPTTNPNESNSATIPVIIGNRIQNHINNDNNTPMRNAKIIQRSNKVGQALKLPSIMNINPRSVYNKHEELQALILEEDIDCTFLSESWERPYLTLEQLLTGLEEEYRVISNPHARTEGRTG